MVDKHSMTPEQQEAVDLDRRLDFLKGAFSLDKALREAYDFGFNQCLEDVREDKNPQPRIRGRVMAEHTSWDYEEDCDDEGSARFRIYAGTWPGETVAATDWHGRDGDHEPDETHARLIAAAPSLLAACEAALAYAHDQYNGLNKKQWDAEVSLRAALAKAKGVDDA